MRKRAHDRTQMFGTGGNGLLVHQDLDEETVNLDEQRNIRTLQASDLEEVNKGTSPHKILDKLT